MKSTYEMIKRKALESPDGYFRFEVSNPSEALISFSIGVGDEHASERDEHGLKIEVWFTTRIKVEDIPGISNGVISAIRKYDTEMDEFKDEWFEKTGHYDYHMEYVYSAYVADIFPSLYPIAKKEPFEKEVNGPVAVNTETGDLVTFKKGSLAEFAASHGCDYMDMSTMTLYRGL